MGSTITGSIPGAVTMTPNPEPPALTPEQLVAQIVDDQLSTEQQHAALLQLQPFVQRLARIVSRRAILSDQLRNDFVVTCLSFVFERLDSYRPDIGLFEPWVQKVLYRCAIDQRRQADSRHRLSHLEEDTLEAPQPRGEEVDSLTDLRDNFREIREILDRLAMDTHKRVDYFAVLLLHFRISFIDLYFRERETPPPHGEVPEQTVHWLPWHAHEELRRMIPQISTLGEVWRSLIPYLDHRRERDELLGCACDAETIQRNYPQWLFRARQRTSDRLAAENVQSQAFYRLMDYGARETQV